MYRDSLPRFVLFCASALVLVPALASAQAPPDRYRWSGFYLGGHVDFGRGMADTTFDPKPDSTQFANLKPVTLSPDPNGTGFRISGGVNHRAGIFLIGGEGDWGQPNTDGEVTQSPIIQNSGNPFPGTGFIAAGQSTDWIVTGRVRAGCVFANRVLVYGAAGLAYASVNYYAETDFRPAGTTDYLADFNKKKLGWTIGIGAEYRLNRMFGIQGEWRFMDLRDESTTVDPVPALPPFQMQYTWKTQSSTVSVGGIIHF
jgi:outer membrane immunogenic protein